MTNQKTQTGKILAISISDKKGARKNNVDSATLKEDFGIIGDAHAGTKNRQVSLLAQESIDKMKAKAGDFAENITTEGLDLLSLKIGDRLKINEEIILELSQIGKVCHTGCSIYYHSRDCVMPKEGIFVKVIKGGSVKEGDEILVDS